MDRFKERGSAMTHDAACEEDSTMSTREPILCGCAERALAQADAALLELAGTYLTGVHIGPLRATFEHIQAAIAAARQRQEGRG